jgi:hypothetical protein
MARALRWSNAGLPAAFWPYAARHFCFGLTIRTIDEKSAYKKQLGEVFPGMRIPFGCKVFFKPSPLSKSQPKKFEGQALPGLFFGYKLDPGGKWSGEYLVVALDAMVKIRLHRKTPAAQLRVHVQSVEEVLDVKPEDVFFPLREAYNIANETFEGAAEHAGVQIGVTNQDLPEPVQTDVVEQMEDPAELIIDPQHEEEQPPVAERQKAVAPPTNLMGSPSGKPLAPVNPCGPLSPPPPVTIVPDVVVTKVTV